MEATELMIGDWIKLSEKADWVDNIKGMPVQVAGLCDEDGAIRVYDPRPDSNYRDFWSDDEEDFEPIPLTDEILQKNGFDCSDPEVKQYHFKEGKEKYHFSLRQMYNKKNEKDGYAFYAFNVLSLIINVHDLQHALRLCGIEKEIVL